MYPVLKRLFDLLFSLALAISLAPVLLLVALAIRLSSNGPIVYQQQRVGKDGRVFTLYKFRTMIKEAEQNGPVWAEQNDPRVTPVGQFLRNTHLDELPQLWNVIKGDMSLIGPRPERPEFVPMLSKELTDYERRHAIRPGISGLAQVTMDYGKSMEHARKKLAKDLDYIENASILLDVKITAMTIATILS